MKRLAFAAPLLLALAVLSLLDSRAQTTLSFVDSGQALGSRASYDVALGDLDGDGDRDAFVANFGSGGSANTVWLNDGGGTYTDTGQQLGSGDSYQVALGDLDDDGDLDAVVGNYGPNTIWLNDGGAGFSDGGQQLGGGSSWGIALGDVDGDADLDAVVANAGAAETAVLYLNQGGAQAGTPGAFAPGPPLNALSSGAAALGDLDGDGDLDLYLGVTGGAFADEIWLNDGSGSFTNSGQALGSAFTSGVTLGDVDGDGDLDAVAANLGAGRQHAVWINQGGSQGGSAGVFAGSGQTTLTGATLDVELGDLDGDGDLDAFLPVYYQAGPNRIWLNDGGAQGGTPGQFSDAGLALGSAHSYGGALDDVDADGDLDLFTANYGNGTVAEPNRVWLNQPVAPPTPTPLPTPLPAGAEGWQRQLVATRGVTGLYTELALDSSGRPHVLFVRQEPTDPARPFRIVLAGWDGIRWQEQVIAAAADLGDEPILGLALDSQDRPAVVFQAQLDASGFPSYWVARWDGAAWQRDFLHYGDDDKPHAALAFGSNDRPHVTFATFDSLVYAYWDGAAWQQEDVADNFSGRNSSLAVDTHGQPHVSYRDRDRHLWYAYRDGGGWHRQPVDPAQPQPGAGTALVLDAADTPHIAYLEGNAFQPTALRVASRQGAGWAIAAVDTAVGVYAPTLALALDPQQRPHVLVVEDPGNDASTRLFHHAWDGSAWQKEQLDPGGDSPSWPALAFDAAGRLHASYHYRRYNDLVYLAWDRFWQTRDVGGGGPAVGPALAMNGDGPGVSFYDVADGRLHVSQWQDGAWQANPAAFLGNPPADSSLFMSGATPSLSYYDADGQRLLFSQWDGAAWQTQVVDDTGDVGRYNDLFGVNLAGLGTHITYWDATTHRVKFAHIHADGSVTRHTNVAGPPLDAGSGHLSGGWLPGGHVVVSYYDGVRGDLRLATWDRTSGAWTDERVDGAAADVGQFSTLRVDAHDGVPVVAYYDATNQAIKLAYRHGGGWQTQVAVPAAGAVQSVALELGYGARDHARITYVDPAGDRLLIALLETGQWRRETIAVGGGVADAATAGGARLPVAYGRAAGGPGYAFRSAPPGVVSGPDVLPPPDYNPLYACAAAVFSLFGDDERLAGRSGVLETAVGGTAQGDERVFGALAALFRATPEGERYVQLYLAHGPEMGRIGLADPALLWDGYGTLQNFMPGLAALVSGNGRGVTVTQQMADDALDVWTRIAAQASPALAAVIQQELAASSNLQDFVGLTFDEWALAIGVPPPRRVFLPVVNTAD